ncbi:C69 family dipeptidase [Streptococcus xiaochunlingii]|uniref:C69 family dipeptidase n=1 Tax=Streptococcus TaxID=1301 RepID=UPI000660CC86|nr:MULTISPECIES: C69 family dipeptidase [Streptococcus]AMP67360.1 amylase-binding protein [Streptococcus sp. A12]MDK8387390.1 C69 family dipeptidase [Streptococcus xiaochunlingii]MDK8777933.1 C69 family dipeptidase [Streptococcus xiaochunlingii]RSK02728.1 Dipeptidase A [Streptococcus sp. A12]RSK10782.1 Dipeptidase A [Streptococcus australis]
MKKWLFKLALVAMTFLLLPIQAVQACCGFIIGRQLTKDGTTLFGRTEDYPYYPNGGKHNKNYVVVDAKTYNEGDQIEDESNGFTYPHATNEMKYTATYDSARGDGSNGAFGEHGFNEAGVSMTATVTAIPNKKVLTTDPLKADGLPEAAMLDVILPRVKTAREGVELLAKVIEEKGSAEGNVVVFADQNETWYMEILSGHQYVAVKVPEDKYAVFANTYYLGHVDLNDTENVIASKDVEKVAKESGNYKTDKDGNFHIAKSYGPEKYAEGDRSRTYAGITLLDPDSKVTYEDDEYELFRSPTDPNKKYTLEDAFALQRNRFEHLNGRFVPDDQIGVKKQGDDGSNDTVRKDQYKYALGNENVIDAHVYQINPNLPKSFGGTVWIGMGPSRNTPYVPFYGNVKDTYEAFKPQTATYDPNSWYWTVWHIDQMAINNQDLFGKSIQNHWKALEEQLIIEQKVSDAKYAALKADEAAAKGAEDQVTAEAIARSERLFKQFKQYEAELSATLKEAGRTDDPYRASLPDDYKEPTDATTTTAPSTEPSTDATTTTEPSVEPSTDATTTTEPSVEPSTDATTTTEPSVEPSTDATTTTEPSVDPSTDVTTTTDASVEPSTDVTTTTEASAEPSTDATTTTEASVESSTDATTTNEPSTDATTTTVPSTEPSKNETKPTQPSTEPNKDVNTSTKIVPAPTTNNRPVLPTNSYILVDPLTGITLQNPDFAQGGFNLAVSVLKDVQALKGKDYKIYDIQLSNQNGAVHQFSPTVVTMPVDPTKEVESVVGIGEDGKVETYQFSLNEDKSKVTFTTNHFSSYGVVYKTAAKVEEKTESKKLPSTGQTISMVGIIGGVLISALGFAFYVEKRKQNKA